MSDETMAMLERYRALAGEYGITVHRFRSPAAHSKMQRYLDWCRAREIDPALFMRFRITLNHERHGVMPGVAALVSDDAGSEYLRTDEAASLAVFESKVKPVYDLVGKENAILYSRVRDAMQPPAPHEDALRRGFLERGMPGLCRAEKDRTGGFDARSAVCPACPESSQCAAEANRAAGYDLVALRRGAFDKLPPIVRRIAEHSTEFHTHVQGPMKKRQPRGPA